MSCIYVSKYISFVILNWNGGEKVCQAITSVLEADIGFPHQVIVVDNDSTDGSDLKIEHRFPQVTMLRNSRNLGFAAGNNRGINYALENGADGVFLLNNDAVVERTAPTIMASALFARPNRGVVVPKILFYSSAEGKTLWAAGAEWRAFPPRVKMRGYGKLDRGLYDQPESVEYATGCALLIHRQTFEQVGLLNESFFMYQEDYEFCDRVRVNGLTIWYEPNAVVKHHSAASTGEGSSQKWRYWSEGIALFYILHYGRKWRAFGPLVTFFLWFAARELAKGRTSWIIPVLQGVVRSVSSSGKQTRVT
jgi:hypothetical protein